MKFNSATLIVLTIFLCCCSQQKETIIDEATAQNVMNDVAARNKAYQPLTERDDTMMQQVVVYYNKYGTPNKRMEAYYLLGSVYRDLHDAPKAMEAFLDGINAADTTSKDCRYDILVRLYGQRNDILCQQKLYKQAAEEILMIDKYSLLAKDTLYAMVAKWSHLGMLYKFEKYDTVADGCWRLLEECQSLGLYNYAASQLCTSILANVEVGRIEDARKLLSIYERDGGDVDTLTYVSTFPIYYYTKGKVLTASGDLEQAEIFFRRELTAQDWNNRQAAYRGLHEVFQQRDIADSAYKYAVLQCEAVDSDYQEKVTENLQNLNKLYDYSRAQEDSHRKGVQLEQEQHRRQRMWWGGIVVLIGGLFTFYHLRMQYRKRITDTELELERANMEQTEMMLYVAELQDKLRNTKDEYEREKIMEELDNAKKDYDNVRVVAKNLRRQYFSNPLFRKMLLLIKERKIASDDDYSMIELMLQKEDESLMSRFYYTVPRATKIEKEIFLLRRMGMTKTEIALLTAHAKNSIITAIVRLYEKERMHKPHCSAEADEWLLSI